MYKLGACLRPLKTFMRALPQGMRQLSGKTQQSTKMTLDMNNVNIKPIKRDEIYTILELTEKDWPFYDADFLKEMYDMDPGSFLCAELKDSQEVIGCIHGTIISRKRFCGSFHYVTERYRNQGVGRMLKAARYQRVGNRNISIFSVTDREERNLRSGLVKHSLHHTAMYIGKLRKEITKPHIEGISASPFHGHDVELNELVQYDQEIHPMDRNVMLQVLTTTTASFTYVAKNETGKITGYIHLHPLRGNWMIFPWVADDEDTASLLLHEVSKHVGWDQSVNVGSITTNRLIKQLVQDQGWQMALECVHMCSDDSPPHIDTHKHFSYTFYGVF